jgi:hypothetical protein
MSQSNSNVVAPQKSSLDITAILAAVKSNPELAAQLKSALPILSPRGGYVPFLSRS